MHYKDFLSTLRYTFLRAEILAEEVFWNLFSWIWSKFAKLTEIDSIAKFPPRWIQCFLWILLLSFPAPIPDNEKKLTEIYIFTLLCGASKGFIKAFKAFIKPFGASQRSVKIKISVNFYFNRTFWSARGGKV